MTAQDPNSAPPAHILREYYHLHFAGRPRVTRNVDLLQQLIALADQGGHSQLVALWRDEGRAIAAEQATAGDSGRALAQAVEAGHIVLHRARRLELDALREELAAIDRPALSAVIAELGAAAGAIEAAVQKGPSGPTHAQAEAVCARLRHAHAACETLARTADEARTTGAPGRRAQVLVRAAQLLLHTFATRIADLDGSVVRPERIEQLATGLTDIVAGLTALGLDDADHAHNCEALKQQAAAWRQEGLRAAALRRQHSADELAHALGNASDAVLAGGETWPDITAAYGEQMAAGISLCDRIDELQRQLVGMPLIYGLAHHHHTLGTVTDAWAYLTAQLDRHVLAAANSAA